MKVNIEYDEITVPTYAVHDDTNIMGFFGKYRFLSNFYKAPAAYDGIIYPSSENAYQAQKTLNVEFRKNFLDVDAATSKKMSHNLIVREDWEIIKYGIMAQIVLDKFIRNQDLKEALLDTGNKFLEEKNNWGDKYWGTVDGFGKNKLGYINDNTRNA